MRIDGEGNRDGRRRTQPQLELRRRRTDRRSIDRETPHRQVKNFLTLTMLSLGIPMILTGDEVRRDAVRHNKRLIARTTSRAGSTGHSAEARGHPSVHATAHRSPRAAADVSIGTTTRDAYDLVASSDDRMARR